MRPLYGASISTSTRTTQRGVYGAIEEMRAVRHDCLYCARCYAYCPRHSGREKGGDALVQLPGGAS